MTNTFSPLQTINQKEREIRRRVEEARQQAEALVQAARTEAEQRIAQVDQAAQTEAERLYQHGIETAQKEAEALIVAAREQATVLNNQTASRLDDAARQVLALVLPTPSLLSNGYERSSHETSFTND